jgi:hypothetical protein
MRDSHPNYQMEVCAVKFKKKKFALIGLSVLVGGVMMCATAFASVSGASGYDAYKAALKNTIAAKSVTGAVGVTVTDNGKAALSVNDIIKANQANQAMSSSCSVTANGKTVTSNVYQQNGQTVTKDSGSDIYNVVNRDQTKANQKDVGSRAGRNLSVSQDMEKIVDLAATNFQNYISLDSSKNDGTKEVSLQMSGSQISPLENAIAALMVKAQGEGAGYGRMSKDLNGVNALEKTVSDNLPKLVDQINVQSVILKGLISDQNLIQEQKADITVSGEDASGVVHKVVISVDIQLSNIGQTTPDKVDLTGKQVKTLQPKTMQYDSKNQQ